MNKDVILNNGRRVTLNVWDTSGAERFMSMNKIFLKGSKGVILLYDITERSSLEDSMDCYTYLKDYIPEDAVIALVGNKLDLYEQYEITSEEGERTANEHNFLFFEVSAKDGTNVDNCFNTLIQRIYEKEHNLPNLLNENNIKLSNNRPGKKGCLK